MVVTVAAVEGVGVGLSKDSLTIHYLNVGRLGYRLWMAVGMWLLGRGRVRQPSPPPLLGLRRAVFRWERVHRQWHCLGKMQVTFR